MAPSLSILFPISSYHSTDEELSDNYRSAASSSPTSCTSSVDCTLSLGTPSTRQNDGTWYKQSSCTAKYWDILKEPKKDETVTTGTAAVKGYNGNGGLSGDPLLIARRCTNCDTSSTPLWRNGPRGPKSLCNACGIRYKKEERRAATSATPLEQGTPCGYQQAQPWSFYGSTKTGHLSMYGHDSSEKADMASYLQWRFNAVPVQERTTLYQYN